MDIGYITFVSIGLIGVHTIQKHEDDVVTYRMIH